MVEMTKSRKNGNSSRVEEVLPLLVEAIVQEVHPEKVILFGSHARGTAGPRSDVDLLVIESEPFGPGRSKLDELGRLYRCVAKVRFPADVLLYSREEADKWRDTLNHVIARAFREGKVLYERV